MNREQLILLRKLFVDSGFDANTLAKERRKLLAFIDGAERLDYVSNSKPKDMPQLVPHLIYDDVAGAIAWLERAFGFIERKEFRQTGAEGRIEHAALQLGSAPSDPIVMLGPPSAHGGSPRTGVSMSLYVYVAQIDRHYGRALEAGAKIALPLRKEPWGDRRYQVTDPEGHQWQFAERCPLAK
jgi:uncharacterized glyoxalase superfamily protein PhnB